MKINLGSVDRLARALIGLALIVAALTGVIGAWGWIGIVPLGTALFAFCPLYAVLGIDSCPIEGFQQRAVDKLLAAESLLDPERFGVSVMAGFGYRAEPPKHEKTRQPLEDLILRK